MVAWARGPVGICVDIVAYRIDRVATASGWVAINRFRFVLLLVFHHIYLPSIRLSPRPRV